jgi:hypothetical protein
MAIIEKDCHGLSKPCRCEDQIKGVIAVDVTRNDLKTAHRRDDLKRLPPGSAELQLNPIVRAV